jgi:hypothetical protein
MRKIKIKSILLLKTGVLLTNFLYAQNSINTLGGDATGSGGSVAYSVGQVSYTTFSGSTGNISQGVQQAYEIYTVGINESKMNVSLLVYPNPTQDEILLEIQNLFILDLYFELTDFQGKILKSEQLGSSQTKVSMVSFDPACYFIHVKDHENSTIKSFKIVKN